MLFDLSTQFLNQQLDIALVKNNALVGAKISVALAQIKERENKGGQFLFFGHDNDKKNQVCIIKEKYFFRYVSNELIHDVT